MGQNKAFMPTTVRYVVENYLTYIGMSLSHLPVGGVLFCDCLFCIVINDACLMDVSFHPILAVSSHRQREGIELNCSSSTVERRSS